MVPRVPLHSLVVVALVVVAGCLGGPAAPGDDTTTPDATTTITTADTTTPPTTGTVSPGTTEDGYYHAYAFEASEVGPEGIAREVALSREDVLGDVVWREAEFTTSLFEDGSATRTVVVHGEADDGDPGPLEDGSFLRDDGTYYRVNKTVAARVETRGYQMHLEGPIRERYEAALYDRARAEAVNLSTLSPADRAVFEYAAPSAERRESGTTSAGYYWAFGPGGDPGNATLLDGERHFVRDDGDLFLVEFEGDRVPAVRYRLRYDLEPVADSAAAFADGRLDGLVTDAEDALTGSARDVVLSAIENGSVEWEGTSSTTPERYREAAAWLADHPPDGRTAYVRYRGTVHRVSVREVVE